MIGPWFPAAVATFIGVVFVGRAVSRLRQQRSWRPACGVVRDNKTINPTAEPGDWLLVPVVEFVTADGATVSARDNLGTNPPRFRPGQQVELRYDPRNPSMIVVGASRWLAVANLAVGILLLAAATAILLFA